MDVLVLVKGFGIGLTVAVPVGPMSVSCMRRTLTNGWRSGMTTGLAIATGDAVYAFVAALGLVTVSRVLLAYDRPPHVAAGLESHRSAPSTGYWSVLLLTLTNPPTIVAFAALFTVIAPRSGSNALASATLVAGVFLGSASWWLVVATAIARVREALGVRTKRWVDVISAAVLGSLGLFEIRKAL